MWVRRYVFLALTLAITSITLFHGYPSLIAAGNVDTTPTPTALSCPEPHTQQYENVVVSQDSKYLLLDKTSFNNSGEFTSNEVDLVDVDTGEIVYVLKDESINSTSVIAISPDNNYILIGPGYDGSTSKIVTLWSTKTGKKLQTIKLKGLVNYLDSHSVAFSSDSKYILLTDYSGVYIWDIAQGVEYRNFVGSVPTFSAVFSPDGRNVLIVYDDDPTTARIWDAKTGKLLHVFDDVRTFEEENQVYFSPDGKYILLRGDQDYFLWDAHNYVKLHNLGSVDYTVFGGTFSPKGSFLWGMLGQTTAEIIDTRTGKIIHKHEVKIVQPDLRFFSDDKRMIVIQDGTEDSSSTFSIRDIMSDKELWSFTVPYGYGQTLGFALTPDNKYIVTGRQHETIRIWDIKTGKSIHEIY